MEFELGKRLLDIAKYLVTALLLASIFSDMNDPWSVVGVIIAAAITLLGGLWVIVGCAYIAYQNKKELKEQH